MERRDRLMAALDAGRLLLGAAASAATVRAAGCHAEARRAEAAASRIGWPQRAVAWLSGAQPTGTTPESRTLDEAAGRHAAAARKLRGALAATEAALRQRPAIPPRLPPSAGQRLDAAASRMLLMSRSRRIPEPEEVLKAAAELLSAVSEACWTIEADETKARKPAAEERRIWLPVPASLGRRLETMGASSDPSVASGSRHYLPIGADLKPFEPFLPLAMRSRRPSFRFPPIAPGAAGQNLWGLLTPPSWDLVRSSTYDLSGRRCQICGRRGGKLLRVVCRDAAEADRRKNSIECHEIWSWDAPGYPAGAGVQVLERLMGVCTDCHMMFHEGFALSRAKEAGLERQVKDFLDRRRMLVNRITRGKLDELLAADRAEWETLAGTPAWIMDLSALSRLGAAADGTLVVEEENRAHVRPDDIAGLSFVTDKGRGFPATPLDQVLSEANERLGLRSRTAASWR
jgi:hypothetical protein